MENSIEKMVINNTAWFTHWFDSAYYHKLYSHRDEKEAASFIDELIDVLQPPPQSRMLDLGCGNGRHSKYLAAKGFDVTGMDLAASSIATAKKSANASLRFYRHDMRVPFGNSYFDQVFSFFTSFGYFKTAEEDEGVIKNISASLKNQGTLVMDYINSPYAERKLVPVETKETDGVMYHITRWMDERHFFKKIVIEDIQPGPPFEYTEQVTKFSVEDFDRMFSRNGLQLQQVFGDYNLNDYDYETSPRLILLAKKRV